MSNLKLRIDLFWQRGQVPRLIVGFRFRHCVECPGCNTRYLAGSSPYQNGSQLTALGTQFSGVYSLLCRECRPPLCSRWKWSDLKMYGVSNRAYARGYGSQEEVWPFQTATGRKNGFYSQLADEAARKMR